MVASPGELARGVNSLSTLPDIFARLSEEISNPGSSATDLAQIVSEDTALAGKLLKLANSAFYGFPRRIDTITHAVAIVGMGQLQQLTLAISVVRAFKDVPPNLIEMESFWKHSFACALLARVIGQQGRYPDPERLFVAGLLHDVGRLVLFMKEPAECMRLIQHCRETGTLLVDAESEAFGYHHGDVGKALLELWKVPAVHLEVAALHHTPLDARQFSQEARTVHVADVMANALRFGSSGEGLVPHFVPEAWDSLGIPADQVPSLIQAAEDQLWVTMQIVVEGVA
ncbi:HDOD domain protein [Planctomycetes bacterium Pan216]|uniref:HDOD domain protein n=1 Tax=Kolteria novifilia TaxID=2527975 RepID=A0A518BB78_9BACT|nr:HDOD domain protein [Planctomycetes bacterium Pan216]